jgi:hypothetical protein
MLTPSASYQQQRRNSAFASPKREDENIDLHDRLTDGRLMLKFPRQHAATVVIEKREESVAGKNAASSGNEKRGDVAPRPRDVPQSCCGF